MCHMFDALRSEFIYVSCIGLHVWQGQLNDFNFARPPSTRLSVLFRVFEVPAFVTGNFLINNILYSEQKKKVCCIAYCIIQPDSVLSVR